MAEKQAKKDKGAKKKGKGQASGESAQGAGMSISAHPRAAHRVTQAKGWGGLLGFLIGGYLSLSTHTPAEAGFRALLAGIGCYCMVWAGAVFLWRHLVVAELRSRQHALLQSELARLGAPTRVQASAQAAAAPTQVHATTKARN
jgi:hypothetical protein